MEEYARARALFRDRLEALAAFRVPDNVSRERGVAVEAQVAEQLGGPAVTT